MVETPGLFVTPADRNTPQKLPPDQLMSPYGFSPAVSGSDGSGTLMQSPPPANQPSAYRPYQDQSNPYDPSTPYDPSNPHQYYQRDLSRREFPALRQIMKTSTPSTAAQDPKAAAPASVEVQQYIEEWKVAKANATNVLWPFLTKMLVGTNSTVIVGAAWSIYAHLIPTEWVIFGPFFYGLTSLSTLDEHATIDDKTRIVNGTDSLVEDLLFNGIIIDLYHKTWNDAYAALNQSGHLEDLRALNYANGYYNQTLPLDSDEEDKIGQFFLSYCNRSIPAGEWSTDPFQKFKSLNSLRWADFVDSTANTSLANSIPTSSANTKSLARSS